jgi:signal transduction histidine kinase
MRERVALFGGELHAGPRPEGGFQVVARLPLDGTWP